ncbi:hypothetical protein BO94DRAFT_609892 [Aspergillus sclerotioniger CBS 115572]|uniref:Uncharacterized protein n=1 Tax=Aspergillus sclerotioniger CBS 115572 TaxID=1450535 RepID=A0A317XC36_9EURO|nr:hypothetical protein BO94DRAFT_609892 [Aspergillus sclerotioniger CBS 115572]PWY94528.1 hypothetical protein BO94DRAFT_609892 [Aspergillus sclerotioniger CBS 115572]
MSSITTIRTQILTNPHPQRLVLKLPTKELNPQNYRLSARDFLNTIFPNYKDDNRINFLAIEIQAKHTYIAIDVNNFDYDFETAHETTTILPVYVLWNHKRNGWYLVRWSQEDEPLARKIADLHDLNGFEATVPFLADFNGVVVYENSRYLDGRRWGRWDVSGSSGEGV